MLKEYKNKKNLIVLGVSISLIILVCFSIFLIKPDKAALASKELEALASSIRNSYKNSPGYWGLDTKFVISNGLAPDAKDGKIVNLLGKDTLVGYDFEATTLMPGSKTFDIVYKDIDKKECVSLLSVELSEEQKLSLISVILKNNLETIEFSWGGDNKLPISINMAKRFCKNKNDILWRFE